MIALTTLLDDAAEMSARHEREFRVLLMRQRAERAAWEREWLEEYATALQSAGGGDQNLRASAVGPTRPFRTINRNIARIGP